MINKLLHYVIGFSSLNLILDVKISSAHLGYSGKLQKEWHQQSQVCSGRHQSPIHIDTQRAIPLAIPALEFVGFHNLVPRPISLTNNGHSVELKSTTTKYGRIFGALLNGIYEVEGIHFHWGKSNNRGSEHVINGIRFPMEMHIVTRNQKYASVPEALTHEDGLAVLAVFFHLRERGSPSLQPILYDLDMVQPDGSTVYTSHSFPLSSLLPKDIDTFYMYRGSLTTPPCSEAVTWVIFSDPMPISYVQMRKFRHLSTGQDLMADNYRHLQPIGRRKIFVRRQPIEFQIHRNIFRSYNSSDFWETPIKQQDNGEGLKEVKEEKELDIEQELRGSEELNTGSATESLDK